MHILKTEKMEQALGDEGKAHTNDSMPEFTNALKRTLETIMEKGGIVRSMENLGYKPLPYKMFKHGNTHRNGTYMVVNFDSPSKILPELRDHLDRDLDIIRPRILRQEQEVGRPCSVRPCSFGELTEETRKQLHKDLQDFVVKL